MLYGEGSGGFISYMLYYSASLEIFFSTCPPPTRMPGWPQYPTPTLLSLITSPASSLSGESGHSHECPSCLRPAVASWSDSWFCKPQTQHWLKTFWDLCAAELDTQNWWYLSCPLLIKLNFMCLVTISLWALLSVVLVRHFLPVCSTPPPPSRVPWERPGCAQALPSALYSSTTVNIHLDSICKIFLSCQWLSLSLYF